MALPDSALRRCAPVAISPSGSPGRPRTAERELGPVTLPHIGRKAAGSSTPNLS